MGGALLGRLGQQLELRDRGRALAVSRAHAVRARVAPADDHHVLPSGHDGFLGQVEAAGGALDQRHAQLFFQPRNGPADARRGLVQAHGGGRKRAAVDDHGEGMQRVDTEH